MKFNEKKFSNKVGVQGYVLMNDRAFCNCQKNKYAESKSHQDAWFKCWNEYKKSYNSDDINSFLKKYVPSENLKKIKADEDLKRKITSNIVKDVESSIIDENYIGASIKNVLNDYIE